ncbi:xanthan lyase [Bacteroidia bacterium]|nr:xanthan lyase [Bacteroidia bacterium]
MINPLMSYLRNIQSISKYESKLLLRSWFFRVFTFLAIVILFGFNMLMLISENAGDNWAIIAIPSNIPYANLLLLNVGQAVIAIFLSSDFLKRDKKLDTSEVFYVRPLSNAEYVIGKIWGNLRVFFILNLIILGVAMACSMASKQATIDWVSYIIYFLVISIPTLIYIIGLSIFLMLLIKNQAITFVLLLGYVGLTLFYISNKFYYVFDYMTFNLPLVKSSIVGFTNWETLLNHRAIYLCAGLAFICLTVSLFGRLPNSRKSSYPWLVLAFFILSYSGYAVYNHVHSILNEGNIRLVYTEINNKYVHTPKMVIEHYDISVNQQVSTFSAEVKMRGTPLETASIFTFCLNPGLQIREITGENNQAIPFEREKQIILVNFGRELTTKDSVSLTIKYDGKIDNSFCYLDIPAKLLQQPYAKNMFNCDKQYSFQTADYLLVTPESYWYPRPGAAYSSESPDWQQTYFSHYHLKVNPLSGLTPISQGEVEDNEDGTFSFSPESPMQAISLVIGKYKQQSVESDGIRYNIRYIDGHDYYSAAFDSIRDTIPALIKDFKEGFERTYHLGYPFKRFSMVEVPAQFYSYPHSWSQAQETVQPEMALFIEKGWIFNQLNIEKSKRDQKSWGGGGGGRGNQSGLSEEELQIRTFNNIIRLLSMPDGNSNFSNNRGQMTVSTEPNPYFLFPQLYNYRYNIFSDNWPVANRIVELYLQNIQENGWERERSGISRNEKANILMEKQNFKELLSDVEHRDLLNNVISLKAKWLFAPAEMSVGTNIFRDSVYKTLERNTFQNLQFEHLLDTLGEISNTDIKSRIVEWNSPSNLPYYTVGLPNVSKILEHGLESYVLKMFISNSSDYDGFIQMNTQVGNWMTQEYDPRANRKIAIKAHESLNLVTIWEEPPRSVNINTMISSNLPNQINQQTGNIKQDMSGIIEEEGDHLVSDTYNNIPSEIIVDNEDSLFSLSKTLIVGLLPKWLDESETEHSKYSGISPWRPPVEWKATTNQNYYGKYIRSAYAIKSGNGNQTATWKVPIPAEGRYVVYYYAPKNNDRRGGRDRDRQENNEYHFKINYSGDTEDAWLNVSKAENNWEPIGAYYFNADTISIVLTNESKQKVVIADAVKVVKQYETEN